MSFPAAPSIVHIGKSLHHWHHSTGELQLISASPLGPDWEAAFFATHADLLVLCRWRVLLLASILPGHVWRQSQKSENSLKVTADARVYVLEEWIKFQSAILVFVYAWCVCVWKRTLILIRQYKTCTNVQCKHPFQLTLAVSYVWDFFLPTFNQLCFGRCCS